MKTMVCRFGLLAPCEQAAKVQEQMRAAHEYRNVLVSIARGERAAVRDAIESVPAVQDAMADARAKLLQFTEVHAELNKMPLADARAELREALITLDKIRREAQRTPEIKARLEQLAELAHQLRLGARAICGCHWGTYQLVEDADERSRRLALAPGKSIALPLWDGLETRDPHYVRWQDATHVVSVQVMGGVAIEHDVVRDTAGDTRVRIEPRARYAAEQAGSKRSQRRRFCTLWLRIGSQPDRTPLWAQWPMIMHRALPHGSTLMRATVRMRFEGPGTKWNVEFVVRVQDERNTYSFVPNSHCAQSTPRTFGTGVIAMDIGWRKIGDELRVATWVDEHGHKDELRLSARMIGSLQKPQELQSIRVENFNAARAALLAGLSNLPPLPASAALQPPQSDAREWLHLQTQTLAQWHSLARLARLAGDWKYHRFDGDEALYAALEAWRVQDEHLWLWESAQRAQSLACRKDFYRVTAARLAAKYHTLVLEAFDLRRISVGADKTTASSNRHLAALSELRECLVHAFSRGGEVHDQNAVDSTHECHDCGTIDEFDASDALSHTCSKCGRRWDQDENAARVLLARWKTAPTGPARSKLTSGESRWSRAKAAKAKKKV